jgi:hypothetical protein
MRRPDRRRMRRRDHGACAVVNDYRTAIASTSTIKGGSAGTGSPSANPC